MVALFLKKVTLQARKNNSIRRYLGNYILQKPVPVQRSPVSACLIHTKAFTNTIRLRAAERDLRLVKRDLSVEPAQYQLLTCSQIHQPEPTLTKELIFSSNVGQHDWDAKSKQIQQWIKKKYKFQITIKKGKNAGKPEKKRCDKAVMCVLGLLSKREENALRVAQGTQRGDTVSRENGKDVASDVLHQ
ncbi:hypothetical protein JEQ12_009446 [Ovis aries]|uniref:Uncharacterized protein n=1 Tax=Ovis aries TaxID=9940 RepID=A0A836AME8_SHEEP|nr:hypothetical protein JEQ12_009446 [Ovis aries]